MELEPAAGQAAWSSTVTSDTTLISQLYEQIVDAVHPRRIILFGSRARGDSRSESDVDLLIVAPSTQPQWQRTAMLYRLLAGAGVAKDLVWWTPEEIEEWRGVKNHFINRVLREGKLVYEESS